MAGSAGLQVQNSKKVCSGIQNLVCFLLFNKSTFFYQHFRQFKVVGITRESLAIVWSTTQPSQADKERGVAVYRQNYVMLENIVEVQSSDLIHTYFHVSILFFLVFFSFFLFSSSSSFFFYASRFEGDNEPLRSANVIHVPGIAMIARYPLFSRSEL
jgi:hypothetical protein